jgi:hypothetical protein
MTVGDKAEASADKPMSAWSRWLIGLAGLGLAVAGLIAVYIKNTNVAGVPLLILAGAAFLYVALTGQRLIQVSKDGVIFAKAARLAKTLNEVNEDPEIPEETKARIADVAEDNGVRLRRPSGWELELSVRSLFEQIGTEHGFAVRLPDPDSGVDFVLVNRNERTIGVEVKSRLRIQHFAEVIRALRATNYSERLLVVDGSTSPDLADVFHPEGVWIVGWGPASRSEWIATLRRMEFLTS